MKINIIFGGKAGQGPNLLSEVVSQGLLASGYYVFYSREYESLIRGGHNYNTLTFSDNPVSSNEYKVDLLVCLDENTKKIHKNQLKKAGIIIEGEKGNLFYAGSVFKILGLELEVLEQTLKKMDKYNEFIDEAKTGYKFEKRKLISLTNPNNSFNNFMNGNQAIALSAIDSGLDFYYAYPMTPATPLMMELGHMQLDKNNKHKVIELENEIAVINAALGSNMVGSIAMVGTSGGGFDLMTEALSLSGISEIPLVIYLAQRPGPSTGLPTYTGQGDLKMALNAGHGEFSRIVVAPGDIAESFEKTNECFILSEKFGIPCILLGDKHLGESKNVFIQPNLKKVEKKNIWPAKFNSYEHDKNGIVTEDIQIINKNFENRLEKQKKIALEVNKLETYKIYGNKDSKNIILFWGSTKGAIIDAVKDCKINAKIVQILYLEPFPEKIKSELSGVKNILVIENNATSPLSDLIAEKTQILINPKNKILKYDGRPFFSDNLGEEIKRRLTNK
jgi:2-oxoglutarate ferredoxin oxidoreductase subunit alpha